MYRLRSPLKFLTLLFVALSLTACGLSPMARPPEGEGTTVVRGVAGRTPSEMPAILETEAGRAMLGIDADGHVRFTLGEDSQILDAGTPLPGGKFLSLHADGGTIYAFWWQKQTDGSKDLFLRVSHDGGKSFGPLTVVDSANGVLMPFALAGDGAGNVVAAYYDERKPQYQIYINRSTDHGRTWLPQDIRLDSAPFTDADGKEVKPFAVEPKVAYRDGVFLVTWKETAGGTWRLLSRASRDGGLTWEPEVVLRPQGSVFTAETLLSRADGFYLVGYSTDGMQAFRSRDDGRSWEDLGLAPGTEDLAAASQTVVADLGADGLLLVYTHELQREKRRVHALRLSTAEGRWAGESVRVDNSPADATHAWSPSLIAMGEKAALAVWEDNRDILPMIYGSWTLDAGQTWSAPRPLLAHPGVDIAARPVLRRAPNGATSLYFDRFHDVARRSNRDVVSLPLQWQDGAGLVGLPESPAVDVATREKRLRERAEAFWKLRVEGRFEETYDFFDPVFRALVTREGFARQKGIIVYHGFEVTDQKTWGNVGAVRADVNFEVPETMIGDKPFKVEPRVERFDTEWVWVQGDWYLVYKGERQSAFLRY